MFLLKVIYKRESINSFNATLLYKKKKLKCYDLLAIFNILKALVTNPYFKLKSQHRKIRTVTTATVANSLTTFSEINLSHNNLNEWSYFKNRNKGVKFAI